MSIVIAIPSSSSSYPEELAGLIASVLAVEARLAVSAVSRAPNLSLAASHALLPPSNASS
jgi:stage V sporulation protein SpoVS